MAVMYFKDPATGAWVPVPTGLPGEPGERGSVWLTGEGPPPADLPVKPYDMYLDSVTGDVYQFAA